MAGAVDIAARVGRVLTQLRASENPDTEWLAECLALWLAGAPFDGALGLSGGWRDTIHRPRQRAALVGILKGHNHTRCGARGGEPAAAI